MLLINNDDNIDTAPYNIVFPDIIKLLSLSTVAIYLIIVSCGAFISNLVALKFVRINISLIANKHKKI